MALGKLDNHKTGQWSRLTDQRMKVTTILHHTENINSKWIKDFNVRPKTAALLEDTGGKLTERSC